MKVYVHWHPGSELGIVVQEEQPEEFQGRLFTEADARNYSVYWKDSLLDPEIYSYLSQFLIPNNSLSCHVLEI